jgi:glucose/arabinose dehydrogenase
MLTLEQVASGLERPLYITHSGDGSGRLFIVEKPGRIRVWQDGQLLSAPFLDIADKVEDEGHEQGLLSVAFHPQYETNGRFFVCYTAEGPDDPVTVAEYTALPPSSNVASPDERMLLRILHPEFDTHNGGQLQFGPDSFLYISTGDGGGSGDPFENGQDIEELLGKILRIDVNTGDPYSSPADNPYAGKTRGRDEIYAIGFRNPWRFSFDRATGQLWVADVGQSLWEEIDIVRRGRNYGWDIMEGKHCFEPQTGCDMQGLVMPVFEYDHSQGCSITGGYVYRGSRSPALVGTYVFADYCAGRIWGLRDGSRSLLFPEGILHRITSFGEDEEGELYVVQNDPDNDDTPEGMVSRVVGPRGGCSLTCPVDIVATDGDDDSVELVAFEPPVTGGECGSITCDPPSNSNFPVGTTRVMCLSPDTGVACTFAVTIASQDGFTITECEPSSGGRRSSLDVTLTGAGFQPGSTVSFGPNIRVRTVTVNSQEEIRVSVRIKKARRGPRDVVVTNPNGATARAVKGFTVK